MSEQDKTAEGIAKSHLYGENIKALVDGGVPALKALDAVLKVYDITDQLRDTGTAPSWEEADRQREEAADTIDRLRAENAAQALLIASLNEETDRVRASLVKRGMECEEALALLSDTQRQNAEQAEQIAELKRDAERYRLVRLHIAPARLAESLRVDCPDLSESESLDGRVDSMLDAALAKPMPKAMEKQD